MSVTLATVADALIEFILSLLRDPETAAEFDEDPEAALAARGLSNVSHADVCAVAPVVVERAHVVPTPAPAPAPEHWNPSPPPPHHDPVVREIKNISQQFTWVDDRDTIVDQSVNQNIWLENSDLTQNFDNDAVVSTGDESIAAGGNVDQETNIDQSTTIEAGDDVHIGDDTTNTTIDDSFNATDDAAVIVTDPVVDTSSEDQMSPVDDSSDASADSAFAPEDTLTTVDESGDDDQF